MNSLLGQKSAVSTITKAIEDGRRHHAWIFYGPRGVGKYTAALLFANKIVGDHLGGKVHPDIHVICKEDVVWSQNPSLQRRKQTNIPIDLLRERIIGGKTSDDRVHDAIAFKTPVSGTEKVFIIDEAELLDEQGQNALLKTLEEPPPNTTIVLVTCRDDLLLPTIHSRCTGVGFSRLQKKHMLEWSENAGLSAEPSDLMWAINFSGGSPGLVCEAVETNLASVGNSVETFLTRENLGEYSVIVPMLLDYIECTVAKKLKQNSAASKESANRRAIELLLLMFGSAAQNIIRSDNPEEGIVASEIISDIEKQLTTNISTKVLVESLCVRWAQLCSGDSVFI